MKVLVIGGGGREHALVWALSRSAEVGAILCVPGNAGIASLAQCIPGEVSDVSALLRVAQTEEPQLVVVGPEVPLAAGLVDALKEAGIPVFGPTRAAAQLESSKAFAKDFMGRWKIPTAAYRVCTDADQVRAALPGFAASVVVKADGLAGGKGVVLCSTHAEAEEAAETLFKGGTYGPPASSIVLEEMLFGPEISFFALCDGVRAIPLAAAQDHKRLGEGDTGPNTGGMGAYSTATLLTPELARDCLSIASRVVDGMAAERTPFTGVLFIGLMLTANGPRVLEFNTRFGDPETEAILLRLETPLVELLMAAAQGDLSHSVAVLSPKTAASVVAASAGYPGSHRTGYPIHGLPKAPAAVQVFHAGTRLDEAGQVVTAGGRVLVFASLGDDLTEALGNIYGALEGIGFEGMQFRGDIGRQAL